MLIKVVTDSYDEYYFNVDGDQTNIPRKHVIIRVMEIEGADIEDQEEFEWYMNTTSIYQNINVVSLYD